ncbi:MAG: bifunctional oligoribonuclease/PAP phosphatase NrnA [Defluviitaleaceae bacterium]|nr:bifunctional oligoribonuclease/PAP phosphatase NrnA [Defluviitaleaceae bacterium]
MEEVLRLINERDSFVVAGHTGPDGDAIGSCFALAIALDKLGKKVQVVLESYAKKYMIIPGREFLYTGELDSLAPEVFIALDCADTARLGTAKAIFDRTVETVCIDHHETNDGFAMYNYIEADASSTCELAFRVIERLVEPTEEIAAAIYSGMVCDTGGFRYNATAKSTMVTAARLMEKIPFSKIYNELMHQHGFSAGKVLGLAMEKSKRTEDKKIVYTFMSREMLASANADPSDMDGIVEYLMGTRRAKAAIFVYEKASEKTSVKVSLRSQGPNMGRVANALGGGGHVLAAGATVEGTIDDVMKRVLKLVTQEVAVYEKRK